MKQLTVKTATEADFFQRGREIARLADHGTALPEECVISFEDVSIIALQYMHIVISFLSRDGLQKSEEQYQHTI